MTLQLDSLRLVQRPLTLCENLPAVETSSRLAGVTTGTPAFRSLPGKLSRPSLETVSLRLLVASHLLELFPVGQLSSERTSVQADLTGPGSGYFLPTLLQFLSSGILTLFSSAS